MLKVCYLSNPSGSQGEPRQPRQLSPTPQFLKSDVWHFQLFPDLHGSPNLLSGVFQELVTSARLRCNSSRLQKSLLIHQATVSLQNTLLAITSEHTANTGHHGNGQAQHLGTFCRHSGFLLQLLFKGWKGSFSNGSYLSLGCSWESLCSTSHLGFIWGAFYLHHHFSFLSQVGTTHSTLMSLTRLFLWEILCSTSHLGFIWGEGSGLFWLQAWSSLKQERSKPAPRNPQGRTAKAWTLPTLPAVRTEQPTKWTFRTKDEEWWMSLLMYND